MELLPSLKNSNIMPINFIYHRGEFGQRDDSLDIVFKDIDTKKHYITSINNPKIEVYIVKPEYRTFNYMRDWLPLDMLDVYTVSYKFSKQEIAKILNIDPNDVCINPYVLGSDKKIESYYMEYFLDNFENDLIKPLSIGYFDIESDTIETGFPCPIGDPPINAVTYIDDESMQSFTFLLKNPNNPQIDDFLKEENMNNFIKELHDQFDDKYGKFSYNLLAYDSEIDLLVDLFKVINFINNDYLTAWNIPYDILSIIERIKRLGYRPEDVICNKKFNSLICEFKEDKGHVIHKRRHYSKISIIPVLVDFMVLYSGIRSGGKTLSSNKLNAVAKKELKDEKYNFKESTDMRHFAYEDYKNFVLYNIKDVLLMKGLKDYTKDFDTMYSRCYTMAVSVSEIFTSTTVLSNSIRRFLKKKDYILGNNRNSKYIRERLRNLISPAEVEAWEEYDSLLDDKYLDYFGEISDDIDEDDDEEDESSSNKKKKKFTGAIVSNANRMESTGFKINGSLSLTVHDDVIDLDIGSEYPTAMIIMNLSNETLIGSISILEDINIPIYYTFIDDEETDYKCKPNLFLIELIQEQRFLQLGNIFLDLPTTEDVLNYIGENIEDFM